LPQRQVRDHEFLHAAAHGARDRVVIPHEIHVVLISTTWSCTNTVMTVLVHDAALAQSSTLIDLLSPPHASAAAHGCAVTPSPFSRAWTAPEAATDASLRALTPTTL